MIDYQKIADAEKFYLSSGFVRVEVPWTVTQGISNITKPKDAGYFQLIHDDDKVLVASAEQSFLYQYNKGFLPKGRFFATTPCFRKDSFDPFHTKYFIKTELIDTVNTTNDSLTDMITTSKYLFQKYFTTTLTVLKTGKDAYDIMYKDIEIGSYGIRSCSFLTWVYGTGIAEPRLTRAIESDMHVR